jgi:tRNA A-37 threonylcarbamoyl transferase component Bud32
MKRIEADRFETLDEGRLTVHRDFLDLFRRHGLVTFESFDDERLGEFLRDVGPRANVRLTLDDQGGPRTFFLKRHVPRTFAERLASWFRLHPARTAARVEWENIRALDALDIPSMTPVVLGEDPVSGRSFILTEAIPRGTPSDDYAREYFAGDDRRAVSTRRTFVRDMGGLVRRFHAAGLSHRDLYLCHVFVREREGGFDLHLIDLQRMGRRRLRRWKVKDVAQLEYSRPEGVFTRTDLLRFLHSYFAAAASGPPERRFVRDVLRKVEAMRRRVRAKEGRRG